jgi:hypothetical protein
MGAALSAWIVMVLGPGPMVRARAATAIPLQIIRLPPHLRRDLIRYHDSMRAADAKRSTLK